MNELTTSGDRQDVATFFKITRTTLFEWMREKPPRIPFMADGKRAVFLEDDIIREYAKRYVSAEKLRVDEILEKVRTNWRNHLRARRGDLSPELRWHVDDLERRLSALESKVSNLNRYANQAA